jgi:hypothetical protein
MVVSQFGKLATGLPVGRSVDQVNIETETQAKK